MVRPLSGKNEILDITTTFYVTISSRKEKRLSENFLGLKG